MARRVDRVQGKEKAPYPVKGGGSQWVSDGRYGCASRFALASSAN